MPDKRTLPDRPSVLLARLRDVVQRVGGVTRATELTGVSRAQLTRYLQGTSDMKLDNLVALAQGLNVPIGWLMGDVGSTKLSWLDAASDIRRNTAALLRVLQRFDTPRAFQSHEIASIIELMVISQHHGRETSGIELPLAERDIFDGLTYVSTMRAAPRDDQSCLIQPSGCHGKQEWRSAAVRMNHE